jgi:SulP family sulfate permease
MNTQAITRNTLAGITTSLAMVPEVVAFALLAHVNPLVGLYAAVVLGLVTALFGGRPGLISGGAGSLAVVSVALVVTHGVEYLFACIVLMGAIQFAFGAFKLGKLIKLVSPSVMTGFVNGLALVIFMAQFHQIPAQGFALCSMLILIGVTIIGVLVAPRITRHVPGSLFGIVLVTAVVYVFGITTKTVGDIAHISGAMPTFHLPLVPFTWDTLWIVLPYSVILAAVGLIETLLTANLVDKTIGGTNQPNRESMAQGAGNVLTGFFGGMGGCAMIGQTVINLEAGGHQRLAGIVEALAILAYIVFASIVIESIPIAALIGVMCVVCYHTFDWSSLSFKGKPRQDIAVMLTVTVATVVFNLAYAVLLGVVLTSMLYYWKHIEREI